MHLEPFKKKSYNQSSISEFISFIKVTNSTLFFSELCYKMDRLHAIKTIILKVLLQKVFLCLSIFIFCHTPTTQPLVYFMEILGDSQTQRAASCEIEGI